MLFDPLEEKFNLPPVVIQFCNRCRTDSECICEEYELPFVLIVPIDDPADFVRIPFFRQLTGHIADSI